MSRGIRVRLVTAVVLLVLGIVFVPPWININRFRRSILQSISAGLGRPVRASSVELSMFPRPAFVLHDLIVDEDPAYGAEPVLMASSVTASLRASTFWHRRVEIATLRFDAPSLNLTRNPQGRWNFEPLLSHSTVPSRAGSSGAAAANAAMPFPYVEATEARINFKLGAEKLPFSLEEADLAVWTESARQWRLRLRARPVRTDIAVSNAGQIRVESALNTAGPLEDAPIRASVEWRRVQLGEISRLLHREDDGWRGTLDWTATIRGTLADARLRSDVQVEEFRRAEFVPLTEMDWSASCSARYLRSGNVLDGILCTVPVGSGELSMRGTWPLTPPSRNGLLARGDFAGGAPSRALGPALARSGPGKSSTASVPTPSAAPLHILLRHAPAQFFLELFRHIHPGVAADATIAGELEGSADCDSAGRETLQTCVGSLHSTPLTVHLPGLPHPLPLPEMVLTDAANVHARPGLPASRQRREQRSSAGALSSVPITLRPGRAPWTLQPAHVMLGGATPLVLTGSLTAAGSIWNLDGPADLAELARLARSVGLPLVSGQVRSLRGGANLAVQVRTSWLPQSAPNPAATATSLQFLPSLWTGSIQIQNASLRVAVLPGSLQLASATVGLAADGIQWRNLSGTYARTPFTGSVGWQIPCPSSGIACGRTFTLHLPALSVGHLEAMLHPSSGAPGLLERINPFAGERPGLPEISGILQVDQLSVGRLAIENAALRLTLSGHQAQLQAMTGTALGGAIHALGSANWETGRPAYSLHATIQNLRPDSAAALWQERWGRGEATLTLRLTTDGWSTADLMHRAAGEYAIRWSNGGLTAPGWTGTPLARFQLWQIGGVIRDQAISIDSGTLAATVPAAAELPVSRTSSHTPVSVTGTVTFGRSLDLRVQPPGLWVRGSIGSPLVSRGGGNGPGSRGSAPPPSGGR